MTEAERREVHELVAKISDGDRTAIAVLEAKVLAYEATKATDDAVYVLDRLLLIGLTDAHERIVARLARNKDSHPDDRPPWIG